MHPPTRCPNLTPLSSRPPMSSQNSARCLHKTRRFYLKSRTRTEKEQLHTTAPHRAPSIPPLPVDPFDPFETRFRDPPVDSLGETRPRWRDRNSLNGPQTVSMTGTGPWSLKTPLSELSQGSENLSSPLHHLSFLGTSSTLIKNIPPATCTYNLGKCRGASHHGRRRVKARLKSTQGRIIVLDGPKRLSLQAISFGQRRDSWVRMGEPEHMLQGISLKQPALSATSCFQ